MRGIHPKLRRLLACAALVPLAVGCQGNQRTASINPFLSPNRVAPPATRSVAPGTAQPYYPGDPLPTMQSGSPAQTEATFVASGTPSPSTGTTLAFSSERSIAIPSDGGTLRFETASDPPEPAQFVAPESSAPLAVASPASLAVEERTAPVPGFTPSKGPWRSPQLASQGAAPAYPVAQAAFVENSSSTRSDAPAAARASSSVSGPAPTMNVQLRAVTSPVGEEGGSSAPRIRIPSYGPRTETYVMPDGSIHEVTYTPVDLGGVSQTVAITPLSVAPALVAGVPGENASRDGFRPRGSTRH